MSRKKKVTQGTPYFFERVSFDEAFPTIQDVSAEVSESFDGVRDDWPKAAHYDKLLLQISGEEIKCGNRQCKGGLRIGNILRKMVSAKLTVFESIELCNGYEVYGKSKYKCCHVFKVNVSIKYREDKA